jgi:hypothetical protein
LPGIRKAHAAVREANAAIDRAFAALEDAVDKAEAFRVARNAKHQEVSAQLLESGAYYEEIKEMLSDPEFFLTKTYAKVKRFSGDVAAMINDLRPTTMFRDHIDEETKFKFYVLTTSWPRK